MSRQWEVAAAAFVKWCRSRHLQHSDEDWIVTGLNYRFRITCFWRWTQERGKVVPGVWFPRWPDLYYWACDFLGDWIFISLLYPQGHDNTPWFSRGHESASSFCRDHCGARLLPAAFFWCVSDLPVSQFGWPALTGKKKKEWINWYWRVRRRADPRHSQHLVICCQISCRGTDLRFVFVSRGWAAYPEDCCWPPWLSAPTASLVSPWCSCGSAASWSSRPLWLKTNPGCLGWDCLLLAKSRGWSSRLVTVSALTQESWWKWWAWGRWDSWLQSGLLLH